MVANTLYEDEDLHDDVADHGDEGGGSKAKGNFEAQRVLHGAPDPEHDAVDNAWYGWEILDSDDDEEDDVHAVCPGAVRIKNFHDRPEWLALSKLELLDKPDVQGCFLAYHKVSRTWQSVYPEVASMSCTHDGITGRSPEHALLDVMRRMLAAHCSRHKKDKIWAKRLEKVTAALESEASKKTN